MAKKDDPPVDAFEDDGWDFGPPSARRSSLRPGARRSLRPAAEAVRAVEAQRKDDAKRVADQGFVESGWSEPPQADDEPTLIAAPNAGAAALAASSVIHDAPVASLAPAVPVAAEPVVSVAPAPAISAAPPVPAVSVAPAVSAPPAARRAAVRPAATRTGPQPSLAQTARMRAATPISFPAEARPSVPALSIPGAAPKVSMPAAAAASVPAAAATESMPAVKASLPAAAAASVAAAAPSVSVSTPAPTPMKEESVAPSSGPTIEIASERPVVESHDREPDSVSGARLVHPSRRPPSPTASFRPVVPDAALARVPAPRKRMTATNVLPLVSLVLSTMGIGFLMFGGSPSAEATTAARAEPVPVAAPAPEAAKAPEHVPAKPAERQNSKKPAEAQVAAAAPKKVEELPLSSAPAAATPVAGDTVKVELSVYPYDAAVGYLGIMQKGGPRYTFEVPKGKSIAVEVARKGYGTRKVTLDGTQTQLSIGLRKTKSE